MYVGARLLGPWQVLVPVVLGILRGAMEACPAPPTPDAPVAISPQLLLKEASYDAVGAASYDLHDHVDLESWSATASLCPCTVPSLEPCVAMCQFVTGKLLYYVALSSCHCVQRRPFHGLRSQVDLGNWSGTVFLCHHVSKSLL